MTTTPKAGADVLGYARKWHANGIKPEKVKNPKTGRMQFPVEFKFYAVTTARINEHDVPLIDGRIVAELILERDALLADAKRLDWLDSQEADVRYHRERGHADEGEYFILVQIAKGKQSISGHPLGYVRDAIDEAIARCKGGAQ